jgi:flagellar biosynthesis/type III secretory pathway M-ring protein FliF/YscJ
VAIFANLLLFIGGLVALICLFIPSWEDQRHLADRIASEDSIETKKLNKQETEIRKEKEGKERQDKLDSLETKRKELREKTEANRDKLDETSSKITMRRPWYALGMMVGFVLTFCGGLVYMFRKDYRMVGAILILATLGSAFLLAGAFSATSLLTLMRRG